MKWRKIVVLFLVASMFLSLISCIRQTALPQEEHTSEENSTVQEKYTTEDSTYPQKETMDDLNNPEDIQDSGPADIQKEGYVTSSFSWMFLMTGSQKNPQIPPPSISILITKMA